MEKNQFDDITIEITNKCNLKCKFCNIWKEKEKMLSFKVIRNTLLYLSKTSKICSVSITGGEPFLHPQFEKIIKFLTLLRISKKIKYVGIYSNGYATSNIINVLNKLKEYLFNISLGISLDGLEKEHNYLRGENNAFKSTLKTIENINRNYKGLINLEIKFTINELNYSHIYQMYHYCKKNNIFFSPKFVEYNVKNYYHRKKSVQSSDFMKRKKVKVDTEKQLLKILKEENNIKNKVVDIKIIQMLLGINRFQKRFIKSCLTPSRCLFIDCTGKIYPCLYMKSIGNIEEIENIISRTQHRERARKGLRGECPRCFAYHGFLKEFNFYINNS